MESPMQTIFGLVAVLLLLNSHHQSEAANATDACTGINCQQGACVLDTTVLWGFSCKCKEGWTQLGNLSFLGCGIPDCQLNFSCSGSPPVPSPVAVPPPGLQINACMVPFVCGSGDCVTIPGTGILGFFPSYKCNCHPGYANLLNMSTGICIESCNLEGSCSNLQFPLTPSPPSPVGTPNDNGGTPTPPVASPNENGGKRHKSVAAGLSSVTYIIAAMWLWL